MYWPEELRKHGEQQIAEDYAELPTDELQRRLLEADTRLTALKQHFPKWTMLGSLDPVHMEVSKLEYERKHIIVGLSKRRMLEAGIESRRSVLDAGAELAKSVYIPGEVSRSISKSQLWREFRDEFQALADEEHQIVRATNKDCAIRANCTYEEHPEVFEAQKEARSAFVLFDSTYDEQSRVPKLIETEKIGHGPFCFLKTPEFGLWKLSKGFNENFQERFQTLATRAGIALGSPQGSMAQDFWLHSLFLDLLENSSEQLVAAERRKGGIILRVCEGSATFCCRLERKALEIQPAVEVREKVENARQSFVAAMLKKKGWSVHQLAVEAELDFHTVNDYLKNRTNPNRSSRKQLANALAVPVEDLPL